MEATPETDPSGRQPIRSCIGCRRRRPMPDLVRIVRSEVGRFGVGRTLPGRGAWLCRGDPTCFDEAVRRGGFARAFRIRPEPGAIEALRADLADQDGNLETDFVPDRRPARD